MSVQCIKSGMGLNVGATLCIRRNGNATMKLPKLKKGEDVPEFAMYIAACSVIWNRVKERRMVIQLCQDMLDEQETKEHPLIVTPVTPGIMVVPAGAVR